MTRADTCRLAALFAVWTCAGAAAAEDTCAATRLYSEARADFKDGRFDDSVAKLRRAYSCDPNPVYLGNIARAYEESNRPTEAIAAWREYLAAVKDPGQRTQTEGRISVLSKLVLDLERLERRSSAPPVPAPVRPVAPVVDLRPLPSPHIARGAFVATAAGVAGVLAGVGLGSLSRTRFAQADAEPMGNASFSLHEQSRAFALSANLCFGVGGTLALAGVVWGIVSLVRSTWLTGSGAVAHFFFGGAPSSNPTFAR